MGIGALPVADVMVNSAGAVEAVSASSRTIHLPSLSASALFSCVPNLTVTLVPALHVPQTGTVIPRCNTMWSLKSLLTTGLS
jgi:hypothetical protein